MTSQPAGPESTVALGYNAVRPTGTQNTAIGKRALTMPDDAEFNEFDTPAEVLDTYLAAGERARLAEPRADGQR